MSADDDFEKLRRQIWRRGAIGLSSIPVHRDPNAALFYDDGSPRLFTLCRATNPPCLLVHPDRWDAFCSAFEDQK